MDRVPGAGTLSCATTVTVIRSRSSRSSSDPVWHIAVIDYLTVLTTEPLGLWHRSGGNMAYLFSYDTLTTEPVGLWHRSGGYMAYLPIDTDRFTDWNFLGLNYV